MENAIAKYDEVRQLLEARREKLATVCADRIDVTRQIELAVLCFYSQPKLMQCTRASIAASVLEASDLGLSLSRSSGEAYLIPRKDTDKVLQCHFQAGYQGLIKLARESGQVNYVHARVVHQFDDFEWGWNPELEFVHRVDRTGRQGMITHVYAVARLTTGELVGECMTVEEIQSIRMRSQRPNEGPWVTDWEEMAKKTVARRLCKWLPKTPRLIRAIESHDADWDFNGPSAIAIDLPAETPAAVSPEPQIAAAMAAQVVAAAPAPTKANRITAQLAARSAALKGLNPVVQPAATPAPLPVPRPAPPQAAPVAAAKSVAQAWEPKTAQHLAEFCKTTGTTFFAQYGRTRNFPIPMTSWSNDHVKRAWEAFVHERDVNKTIDAQGRWLQESIPGRS